MKTITVPADVTLADPLTGAKGEAISFQSWAFGRWLSNAKAGDSLVKIRRWMGVIDLFKSASKPGDEIKLEDEDHATLVTVVEDFAALAGVPPTVLVQLLPFFDAVTKAA